MRIAHVVPTLDEAYGGTTATALNLGNSQAELGEEVSYFATDGDGSHHGFSTENKKTFLYKTKWPKGWFRSTDFTLGITQNINLIDVMEVHGIWQFTSYAASKIARKMNVPYIVRPTGVFMHSWRYNTFKKVLYSNLVGNRMINGAACLHVASVEEAEGCKMAGYQLPMTIVPNGINCKEYDSLPDKSEVEEIWPTLKNRVVVLFLSLISPVKGLDQCLLAIKDIIGTKKHRDLLFVIAGPDCQGYRAIIEKMVKNNCLNSHVLFTGMVRGREKLGLYNRADVFILPSYSENYGLVVAEALASGTPVVTTTATPWKEIETIEAGLIIPPERKAIAEALQKLLVESPDFRKAMGQRGRKHILKNYTWPTAAKKLIDVYQCILEGKQIPLYPE